jgi:hypothetical protein
MSEERNRMDCTEFKEIYHDLDRPGTLGPELRDRALAHAEFCSDCAALLTEAEGLDFALRSLAEHSEGRQAPPRVETALLEEFRREKVRASGRKLQWQISLLGAAAGIALVVGMALHHRIVRAPIAAQPVATTDADATHAASGPAEQASPEAGAPEGPGLSASESSEEEYAGNFVPLPYADDPAALEGGAIVRVTLPRSALVSFGLPITGGGDADTVSADLVVAEDGTPQAIRLVPQPNSNSDF